MVVMVILAATSIHHFSDRAFTRSKTSSSGTSRFYGPRPGLQSTKPHASVPLKTSDRHFDWENPDFRIHCRSSRNLCRIG